MKIFFAIIISCNFSDLLKRVISLLFPQPCTTAVCYHNNHHLPVLSNCKAESETSLPKNDIFNHFFNYSFLIIVAFQTTKYVYLLEN